MAILRPLLSPVLLALLVFRAALPAASGADLAPNASLEADADGNGWPDGWAKVEPGGSWREEEGNHFLRLSSPAAGAMVMLYQEIAIPDGVAAISLSWKQRVTGLKTGKEAWFDARILMEFLNGARKKLEPNPAAPSRRGDTEGWERRETRFLVPEGATILKFMPCLFQVEAGVFDLDDLVLRVTDPAPIRAAAEAQDREERAKREASASARRAKAAKGLEERGSLLTNGDFETRANADEGPAEWGRLKDGGSWESEEGNHFLRLRATAPDKLLMVYRTVDLPEGVGALELSWRERVTGLVKGTSPWFDARIMLEFQGLDGKKLASNPSPPHTGKDTDGWVEKRKRFPVPEEALTLAVMPSLFQVKAGTYDLDDFTLKPTEAAPLIAEAELRAKEARARHVEPETPDKARWPKELHVVGNRVQDSEGNEVWLQGVNAGGLETLPQDKQPIKSVVVAIDEWKANCVRVPVNESFWSGQSPYQKDGGEDYRKTIETIVTLAANRGAYVVIDLHRFRAPKAEHAAFWTDFAALYANHPAVLFDIFNEPHGISWEVWKDGGFVGEKADGDESAFLAEEEKAKNAGFESVGMQGLVDAVRATGARNIIIAGGLFWCNDLSGITKGFALDDRGGRGIMYSWHTYNWHTGWEEKMLATAAAHPVFVGELGADIQKMDFIPADAQEDPYTWVPDMLGFIQKHHLHWTGWCLHPKATPVMISDWSYTPTPFWGAFAKQALAGKAFELKKTR